MRKLIGLLAPALTLAALPALSQTKPEARLDSLLVRSDRPRTARPYHNERSSRYCRASSPTTLDTATMPR
jgi:hypothetical protein